MQQFTKFSCVSISAFSKTEANKKVYNMTRASKL